MFPILAVFPANALALVPRGPLLATTWSSPVPQQRQCAPVMLKRTTPRWMNGRNDDVCVDEICATDDAKEQLPSMEQKWLNNELCTISYAEESRQFRRTGKRLAVGFERSAGRRDSFLAAASPQPQRTRLSQPRVCVCVSLHARRVGEAPLERPILPQHAEHLLIGRGSQPEGGAVLRDDDRGLRRGRQLLYHRLHRLGWSPARGASDLLPWATFPPAAALLCCHAGAFASARCATPMHFPCILPISPLCISLPQFFSLIHISPALFAASSHRSLTAHRLYTVLTRALLVLPSPALQSSAQTQATLDGTRRARSGAVSSIHAGTSLARATPSTPTRRTATRCASAWWLTPLPSQSLCVPSCAALMTTRCPSHQL